MNQIDYWNEGIGTLIFIVSIPIFVFLYCAIGVAKDYLIEFIESKLK